MAAVTRRPSGLARVPPELPALALGLFKPLEILGANAGNLGLEQIPRPFVVITGVSLLVVVALGRWAGSRLAGAYVAVAWLMLFWSAPGIAETAREVGFPGGYGAACTALLLLAGVAAAPGLGRYVREDPGAEGRLTSLLAAVGLVFGAPALGGCLYVFSLPEPPPLVFPPLAPAEEIATRPETTPDVYMILLDAYARADVLRDLYATDDGPFRARLEGLGFDVADDANSNYAMTLLSMASVLNLDYLPDASLQARVSPLDLRPVKATLEAPRLLQLARRHGYRVRLRGTGAGVWCPGAFDEFSDPGLSPLESFYTTFSAIGELHPELCYRLRRRRLREALLDAPAPTGAPPTWTIFHLVAPHPPFAFAADGGPFRDDAPYRDTLDHMAVLDELNGPGYYQAGYREQVGWVGRQVGELVETILERPGRPALIWVFGDHGPRARYRDRGFSEAEVVYERTAVLSALRAPPGLELRVGEDATLLHTARAIARALFGARLPPVDARVFLHHLMNKYDLVEHPRPARADPEAG